MLIINVSLIKKNLFNICFKINIFNTTTITYSSDPSITRNKLKKNLRYLDDTNDNAKNVNSYHVRDTSNKFCLMSILSYLLTTTSIKMFNLCMK